MFAPRHKEVNNQVSDNITKSTAGKGLYPEAVTDVPPLHDYSRPPEAILTPSEQETRLCALCSAPAKGHNAYLIANLHLQKHLWKGMPATLDWKPDGDRKIKGKLGDKMQINTLGHADYMSFYG